MNVQKFIRQYAWVKLIYGMMNCLWQTPYPYRHLPKKFPNMMSHLRRFLFLQLLLLLVLLSATIEAGVLPRADVRIINNLRPDLNLTIHCKSKNADLGTHLILYEQNFEFDFSLNFWGLPYTFVVWLGNIHSSISIFMYRTGIRDYVKHACGA